MASNKAGGALCLGGNCLKRALVGHNSNKSIKYKVKEEAYKLPTREKSLLCSNIVLWNCAVATFLLTVVEVSSPLGSMLSQLYRKAGPN